MMSLRLRRALLGAVLAVFAVCAVGVLAPAARADGDPGSDVLVYQNLFVAADANISVPRQVELGNLLTSADKAGFPIRVAIVSQSDDLGAITALWQKPAAYASFLGTDLSLAYAQRLLIVMPNGFGFHWQGHPATAIDEGSVEPSASTLPSFLNSLRQPLSYPVAIDDSGQVADGYGVQSEPWFAATSADGKVIWSWEVSTSGWPSLAALDKHVRAALASAAK